MELFEMVGFVCEQCTLVERETINRKQHFQASRKFLQAVFTRPL